jgi:hypothetical protein
MNTFNIKSVVGFIELALNDAVETIKSGLDPIIPFAMTWDSELKQALQRCVSDDYNKAVQMAHDHVRNSTDALTAYCVAWSGYVTMEGTKYDAVLVEAAERSGEKAVLMAMRYTPASQTSAYKEVGNVSLLEYRDNLIGSESNA